MGVMSAHVWPPAKSQPETDGELWRWIDVNGGISRSRSYWSKRLTTQENRSAFRYLDRTNQRGNGMEALAQEIGESFPWYHIQTADDLWDWLRGGS